MPDKSYKNAGCTSKDPVSAHGISGAQGGVALGCHARPPLPARVMTQPAGRLSAVVSVLRPHESSVGCCRFEHKRLVNVCG